MDTELLLQYDAGKLQIDVEAINLTDESLAGVWGDRLYRIRLIGKGAAERDRWVMRFSFPK